MPYKTWVVGEEVLAADFNTYVGKQTVSTFANAAARDAAIAAPTAGMVCYLTDVNALQMRSGSAWVTLPGATSAFYASISAASGAVAGTALVIPGLTATVTTAGSRRIRLTASIGIAQAGGPSLIRAQIREGATQLAGAFQSIVGNGFGIMTFGAVVTAAAGTHAYDVLVSTDAGTAQVSGAPGAPSWLLAEDIG